MKTAKLFSKKKVFSLEVFPPKCSSSVETIYNTLNELKGLSPDFISVTYRKAGKNSDNNATLKIASSIKHNYGIESVAHLPGINLSKNEVKNILHKFKQKGIENILALRGDINPDFPPKKAFRYASDLISFIKENGDFNIIGACYPEGHQDCPNLRDDILKLKLKVDAGTDQLITQVFFDNSSFYSFAERAASTGITIPVEAGIMPIINKTQMEKTVSLCGATLPPKLLEIMRKYENDAPAMYEAGIAYAVAQINDLIENKVEGIHLYTMNNPNVAKNIYRQISHLLVKKPSA